jgi:hypothetical protein
MRRFLDVGFDALQFHCLHGGGLALHFLFEPLQQFALLDDDAVELLDLMLQVREVRLQFFDAPGIFVWHEGILPIPWREVERGPVVKKIQCSIARRQLSWRQDEQTVVD